MGWMAMAAEGAGKVKGKGTAALDNMGKQKQAMLGAAVGAGQMISGAIKKSKAERLAPPIVDPAQAALLEEAKTKQAQIEGGTDALTQANLQEANQNTAAAQGALSRVTGGNVGGTVSAMLGAQKLGGQLINQTYGANVPRATEQQKMANTLSNEISQRKLELQLAAQGQKMAEAANMQQTGFGNFMGGVSTMASAGTDMAKSALSNDKSGQDVMSKAAPIQTPVATGNNTTNKVMQNQQNVPNDSKKPALGSGAGALFSMFAK